ncbi:MAG: hypothetical protein HY554_06520 [Elusimicrobia bacterium]|nr:hypothetical protein [Elusimicrobiota bacterium]
MSRMTNRLRKPLSLAVAAALVAALPGPCAARAAAQGLASPRTAAPAVFSLAPLEAPAGGLLSQIPAAAPWAAPAAGLAAALAPSPAAHEPAFVLPAPAAPASPASLESGALAALDAGASELERRGASGTWSTLASVFAGARLPRDAPVAGDAERIERAPGLAAAPAPSSLAELEAAAGDASRALAERRDAVGAIERRGGEEARAALRRVAEANPEGGAEDYEVHRSGLRALKRSFGELRSLRPVTRAHADAILGRLAGDKPELYVTDYDDTLAPFMTPLSREAAAGLKAAADAGVETVILTDRQAVDDPATPADESIARSLQAMTPAEKALLTVLTDRGTRLHFVKDGELVLAHNERLAWSDGEKAAIAKGARAVSRAHGDQEYQGRLEAYSSYGYVKFLPFSASKERVDDAAALLRAALLERGMTLEVSGRIPSAKGAPPYVVVSKLDKSGGVRAVRANRRALEQMRDLLRLGLPARWAERAWRLLRRLPPRPIPAATTLVVGDQFHAAHNADVGLAKGAPGALALAVGGSADPDVENVFVWPVRGEAASLEIQAALAKKVPSGFDTKAAAGLLFARTVSIAGFIMTSLAYPYVAVPIVGWAGLGALLALGPLGAIATGPLNGLIVDRLSPRNAMLVNTLIKAVFALELPIFAALDIMNFWTLLLGAIGNGWLLSSIMTTESAFIQRMAGKFLAPFTGVAWISYLATQVALNLLLGIGSVIDAWHLAGHTFRPFLLSSFLHAVVILPAIWLTIPNVSPLPKTLAALKRRLARARGESPALREELDKRSRALREQAPKEAAAARAAEAELAALAVRSGGSWSERRVRRARVRFLKTELASRREAYLAAQAELDPSQRSALRAFKREAALDFLKDSWLEAALLAAAVASYPLLGSPIAIAAALLFWISRTASFRTLWSGQNRRPSPEELALEGRIRANEAERERLASGKPGGWQERSAALAAENASLRRELGARKRMLGAAMLYAALGALLLYPLQYFAIPRLAETLAGEAGKRLLAGQFLGALFFGNMIANAAQIDLPELRLPLIGRVSWSLAVRALVLALAAAWVATSLAPGGVAAAAGAVLLAAGLMAAASRLTDRGWIQLLGAGFAAIWLPVAVMSAPALLPFSAPAAMMIALLFIGMFYGPASVALGSYFGANARQSDVGSSLGVQASFINGAISMGYALLSFAAGLFTPVFPATLAAIGAANLLGGLVFWRAPKRLPGLPPDLTR